MSFVRVSTFSYTPLFLRVAIYTYLQTGTIAWRIFLTVRKPLGRSTSLWPILFAIIESSALYALGVIAALVSFLSKTNGQYAAVDAIVPLVVSYALRHLSDLEPHPRSGHRILPDYTPDPLPRQRDGQLLE